MALLYVIPSTVSMVFLKLSSIPICANVTLICDAGIGVVVGVGVDETVGVGFSVGVGVGV